MKIRIAVAVDSEGRWCAHGCHECDDDNAVAYIDDEFNPETDHHVVYVEADVPLPTCRFRRA